MNKRAIVMTLDAILSVGVCLLLVGLFVSVLSDSTSSYADSINHALPLFVSSAQSMGYLSSFHQGTLNSTVNAAPFCMNVSILQNQNQLMSAMSSGCSVGTNDVHVYYSQFYVNSTAYTIKASGWRK